MTHWRGLREKHIDHGVFINNSGVVSSSDADNVKKVNTEIKQAIEKFGPVWYSDPNANYKYQWLKNIYENKKSIIKGASA